MEARQTESTPASSHANKEERQSIIECVRRWGGPCSAAVLDPAGHVFTTPNIDGLIGYRTAHGCAIAFGDPVCTPSDLPALVEAFHGFCKKQGWRVAYLTTSERFAKWAIQNGFGTTLQYGSELIINAQEDPRARTGVNASLVRRKVRHATKEGTSAYEYFGDNPELEDAISLVGHAWLEARTGPQVYIAGIHLFSDRPGKRWFYAMHKDRVVGILQLNKLEARQGWLLNRLMVTPDSPGGTPELLVITALDTLRNEGYHSVSFSVVPQDELGEVVGLGPLSTWIARAVYKIASKSLKLSGPGKFWRKFHPQETPSYLVFANAHIGLRELLALRQTLNMSL